MGWFGDKNKVEERKVVETTGSVNNNLVIQGTVDVYSNEIVLLLIIICFIKIVELAYFLYYKHKKNIKRQYMSKINVNHV